MKYILQILFFLILPLLLNSQNNNLYILKAEVIGVDTVLCIDLEPVYIFGNKQFKTEREARRYSRLVKYVKIVYPYAKICENKVKEYDKILVNVDDSKERRKIMKRAEKEIKEEFSDDIRNLTFSQGKILLKLINRQTGDTSYELLREYRGAVRAVFWQSVACIFGANLKSEFEKEGDDKYIEDIVLQIEKGWI